MIYLAGAIHSYLLKEVESAEPVIETDNELIEAFRAGDEQAGYKLYVKHHKMIIKVILSITNGRWYDDDCLVAGTVGIYEAAKRFDPTLGFTFLTYAVPWIRKYVYIESCNAVLPAGGICFTRNFRDRLYRYIGFRMIGMTDEEIKLKMKVSDELIQELSLAARTTSQPLPITLPIGDLLSDEDGDAELPTPGMPSVASAEDVVMERSEIERFISVIDSIADEQCKYILTNTLLSTVDYAAEVIGQQPVLDTRLQMQHLGLEKMSQYRNLRRKAYRLFRKALRAQERVDEGAYEEAL